MLPEIEELATVVVCEDDEPTRELLCDQLTADRYRVLPAPSASDALRFCAYNQPDLMLLDLGLPDAAGIEVLREVRGADGTTGRFDPGLPVIVLSGRGSEADRVRGLTAGADDYVVKAIRCPLCMKRSSAGRRCPLSRNGGAVPRNVKALLRMGSGIQRIRGHESSSARRSASFVFPIRGCGLGPAWWGAMVRPHGGQDLADG